MTGRLLPRWTPLFEAGLQQLRQPTVCEGVKHLPFTFCCAVSQIKQLQPVTAWVQHYCTVAPTAEASTHTGGACATAAVYRHFLKHVTESMCASSSAQRLLCGVCGLGEGIQHAALQQGDQQRCTLTRRIEAIRSICCSAVMGKLLALLAVTLAVTASPLRFVTKLGAGICCSLAGTASALKECPMAALTTSTVTT